jgi:hypothetical protein
MVNSLVSESDALDREPGNGVKKRDIVKERTPLPWSQLFIVYLVQFAEPVTAAVIFPFINQFVRETGITGGDEKKTGYFAGLIVRCKIQTSKTQNVKKFDLLGILFFLF